MSQRSLLYTDGETESDLAKKVCDQYHINYFLIDLRRFSSSDVSAPRLLTDLGRFEGLKNIKEYAETLETKKVG